MCYCCSKEKKNFLKMLEQALRRLRPGARPGAGPSRTGQPRGVPRGGAVATGWRLLQNLDDALAPGRAPGLGRRDGSAPGAGPSRPAPGRRGAHPIFEPVRRAVATGEDLSATAPLE